MDATTFRRQYPIALQALGQHMLDHDLPAPWSIDQRAGVDGPRVSVLLVRGTHPAWLESVHVDAVDTELRRDAVRFAWSVRLPDTGIQIELVTHRDIATVFAPLLAALQS